MKTIKIILSLLSVLLNIFLSVMLMYIMTTINSKIVYDMDKARNQYVDDVGAAYLRGCMNGADNYISGPMTNSMIWCGKERVDYQEVIDTDLNRFGRNQQTCN